MVKKQRPIFDRQQLKKTINPTSLSIIEEREMELDVVPDPEVPIITSRPVTCRLDEHIIDDLDDIAGKLELSRSALISRILAKTSLEMISYLATEGGEK